MHECLQPCGQTGWGSWFLPLCTQACPPGSSRPEHPLAPSGATPSAVGRHRAPLCAIVRPMGWVEGPAVLHGCAQRACARRQGWGRPVSPGSAPLTQAVDHGGASDACSGASSPCHQRSPSSNNRSWVRQMQAPAHPPSRLHTRPRRYKATMGTGLRAQEVALKVFRKWVTSHASVVKE